MKPRIRLVGLGYLICLGLIVFRLFYWQIYRGGDLSARANNQYFSSITFPADRGAILASDGSVLAGSVPAYFLYLYKPNFTADAKNLADQISEILYQAGEEQATLSAREREWSSQAGMEELHHQLMEKIQGENRWEILAKKINQKQKERVEKLNVPGIGFQLSSTRFYPESSSSAHIIGFVGSDAAGQAKGYFGLEGYYDRELKGQPGEIIEQHDALGRPILVGSFREVNLQSGRDIVTNIDKYIQRMVEEELSKALTRYGASAGEVIIMDPTTGAIMASASFPSYYPARYWEAEQINLRSPIISATYEPGSTFKVLVMAAALDAGEVTPMTECDICHGPLRIGEYLIRTWDGKYHPGITMTDTIVHSDNIGMVFVGQRLGPQRLVEYLNKFGIGQKTGVEMQEEMTPSLREKWSDIDVATASFGQGIAVTSLQMLRAVGAIANGGVLMTPQLVGQIIGDKDVTMKPKSAGRVISDKTAKEVTDMMVKAVIAGEAKFAAPRGYQIAGKTGTAQIPVSGHYDKDKTIASFVGFAPADNPKFVMITKLYEPTSSPWGSETAAPLWFSIANRLLLYWGIPPDE